MTTVKPNPPERDDDEPPRVTEAQEDTALREVIEREPEPDDLVVDPPEAVDPEERGAP